MGRNKNQQKKAIENHQTAAWANIENTKPKSRVPIPAEDEVSNAKDWVDLNEK